MDQCIVI